MPNGTRLRLLVRRHWTGSLITSRTMALTFPRMSRLCESLTVWGTGGLERRKFFGPTKTQNTRLMVRLSRFFSFLPDRKLELLQHYLNPCKMQLYDRTVTGSRSVCVLLKCSVFVYVYNNIWIIGLQVSQEACWQKNVVNIMALWSRKHLRPLLTSPIKIPVFHPSAFPALFKCKSGKYRRVLGKLRDLTSEHNKHGLWSLSDEFEFMASTERASEFI